MNEGEHLYRADRLILSGDILRAKQHRQEAVWIYSIAGTHFFNFALHFSGITRPDQGLPTHNAGYYCSPFNVAEVFESDVGDVIHADMPPTPDLEGPVGNMKQVLVEIEAIAIKALHHNAVVSEDQADGVARLVLSLRSQALNLKSVASSSDTL